MITASLLDDRTRADEALLRRILLRDHAAVGELYDRHCGLLYSLILRMLNNRSDAEDVLQDVFLRVWLKSETYAVARGTPAAWLISIARNRAIDRLRARRMRSAARNAVPMPRPPVLPDESAAVAEAQSVVAHVLQALPPQQRELIEGAYFQGWTQAELADRFRLPLGTVKSRMRVGLLTLREQLGRGRKREGVAEEASVRPATEPTINAAMS